MITCKSGITIRMKVEHIREAGRATQGVKLINLDEGDEIAAIARLDEQEEENENEAIEGENLSTGEASTDSPEAPVTE